MKKPKRPREGPRGQEKAQEAKRRPKRPIEGPRGQEKAQETLNKAKEGLFRPLKNKINKTYFTSLKIYMTWDKVRRR